MPTKLYEAPGAVKRLPGETFASFSARQRASQAAAKAATRIVRRRRVKSEETYETKLDDFGHSPDY